MLKMRTLSKNSFLKNVFMLTSGAAFAQGLNIVLSPVITRIYSPKEYGVLVLFLAILGAVSAFSAMSYDSAIPIAEDNKKALNLLLVSFIILTLGTAIFIICIYLFGEDILNLLNSEALEGYIFLVPIGFFCSGLYNILTKWSIREKNFNSLTSTKYIQSIASNFAKIGLGILSVGPIGLILGSIIGQSAGLGILSKPLFNKEKGFIRNIIFSELIQTAKRYIRFPFYTTPTLFFLSVSGQLPVVFISILYGAKEVGFYGLALSITFLPMTLIGKSVEDVFYGEAASLGRNNPTKIKELSNKLLRKLVLIGIFPMLILMLFGPFLFALIFGANWHTSGVYSSLIALYVFTHFICQPISSVFYIFEKQGKPLILNLINLLSVLLVFSLAFLFSLSPFETIFIFGIAKTIIELLKYFLVRDILNKEIAVQLNS